MTIPTKFNFGNTANDDNLLRKLSDIYRILSSSANTANSSVETINTTLPSKLNFSINTSDPIASDVINKTLELGHMWIRSDTNDIWIMTSRTTEEAVTWKKIT